MSARPSGPAGSRSGSRTAFLRQRLHSHRLAGNPAPTPEAVVAHYGAMQAQDYAGALWAIGLRSGAASEADVERAVDEGRIVRCWPMRGTLHFVAAEDARWMIGLLAPRVLRRNEGRLARQYGIDRAAIRRARTAALRALRPGVPLTRPELYQRFEAAGIHAGNGRGLHLLFALAHEGVLCFGPRRGKQPTFVQLDRWVPRGRVLSPEEALGELARRYLASHAPATPADFAWWSGLNLGEANEAFALAGPVDGGEPAPDGRRAHLLPPFDEYTVAYRDRSLVVDPALWKRVNAGGGMLSAIAVSNGEVVGTWKRRLRRSTVEIRLSPFRPLSSREARLLQRQAAGYAGFVGADAAALVP